jgi:hypothetical protein
MLGSIDINHNTFHRCPLQYYTIEDEIVIGVDAFLGSRQGLYGHT